MAIRYTQFAGKTAVITGASSGIGAEFARQLHAKGCRVILIARRQERLEALAVKLNSARANSAEAWPADLTRDGGNHDGTAGLEEICSRLENSAVDIFINNAGVGSFGYMEEIPLEYERGIVMLNVYATTRLAHAVLKPMKRRRSGVYVSVSSVAGFEPLPYMSTYSASKAFNLFQTLALRQELADFNVAALAVCPGPTDTEFFGIAKFAENLPKFARYTSERVVREGIRAIEAGRSVVVPGWKAKFATLAVRCLPLALSTYISKLYLRRALPAPRREGK